MTVDGVLTGVSPALLGYCFADRLVAPARLKLTGVALPCRDVAVKADELAGTLFAISFWNLRRQGLLTLELVQKKRLGLFSETTVMAAPAGQAQRSGLEGVILANLGRSGRPVRDVIRDWYREDVLNPAQYVVNAVLREGVEAGWMTEVDTGRGKVGAALLGKTRVEPVCERIAGLEGAFDEVNAEWGRFRAMEAILAKALVDACQQAVLSRRDTTTTNDYT